MASCFFWSGEPICFGFVITKIRYLCFGLGKGSGVSQDFDFLAVFAKGI